MRRKKSTLTPWQQALDQAQHTLATHKKALLAQKQHTGITPLTTPDTQLLKQAFKDVTPLHPHYHDKHPNLLAQPNEFDRKQLLRQAKQRQYAETTELLLNTLSDHITYETLLETDENLSFKRQGISTEQLRKLRKGHWRIDAELDLHGLRTEEARDAVNAFIHTQHQKNHRCLRIIHGKGHGSLLGIAILKDKVKAWLIQKNEVLAFCQARPTDGGAGALIVLITPKR